MNTKQLAALLTISLALNTMAVVLGALLPVVAARRGAASVLNGFYLPPLRPASPSGTSARNGFPTLSMLETDTDRRFDHRMCQDR